jgi:hypothetical protein
MKGESVMNKQNRITVPIRSRIIAVVAALAITVVATRAHAASLTGTVTKVEYQSGNTLVIWLSGGGYYQAQTTIASPCSGYAVNVDTVKGFQGLAMSALLSGKPLTIYYTSCTPSGGSSQNFIGTIDLNS